MKKILAGIVAAVYSVMLAAGPALAQTDVLATVRIETVCVLDVTPDPLDFGTIVPTTSLDSAIQTATLENTGNADIDSLQVSGDDWDVGGSPPTMPVGQTEYDDDGTLPFGVSSIGTPLTSSPTTVLGGFLGDGLTDDILYRVSIPNDQQPAENYDQTITYTFGCDQLT